MKEEIKARTKRIGLEVISLLDEMPQKPVWWVIAKQIIKSSTSIGANYRAACVAKSSSDYINKLKIVEEEADKTIYWLELMEESMLVKPQKTLAIKKETREIMAIVVATIKTVRDKN
jgi:four helix bundle protein